MKKSKVIAIIMSLALLGTLFTGCGNNGNEEANKSEEPAKQEEKKEEKAVEQKIRYHLGADPKTIDPQLNSAVDGSTVIKNAFEGLMREDEKGEIVPGVAEKYDVSDDKLVYTFHLRDCKWSDGQPVKAGDFEYAIKRLVDPTVKSEYAYMGYYVKNAEKCFKGKASLDDVGVKAIDDKTLEITLESPCAYFITLAAFPTYYPVRKDIVEKEPDKWALKPETYVCNGPFKMTEWTVKEKMVFSKNENYWNAKEVKLDTLEMYLYEDRATALNAYRADELEAIEAPPMAERPTILSSGEGKLYPELGTSFYCYNLSDKVEEVDPEAAKAIKNPKVRKALSLAIDRQEIVDKVTQSFQEPATSFVPTKCLGADKQEFHTKQYNEKTANVEEAKKLLAEAGYPDGKGMPTLTITFNTNEGNQNVAMAIQNMWQTNLNIPVELKNEEWKVFQDTRNNFQFVIARHGWVADFNHPMSFLDMWTTGNGQNNAGYSNPKYDDLIAKAKAEEDPAKANDLMHQAEDVLMEDEPFLVLNYNTATVCIKPNVKGIYRSALATWDFIHAYVEAK